MYRKYWKELIVLGLIHYSIIGLVLVVSLKPFYDWYLGLMIKVTTDNQGTRFEDAPVSINGVPCYDQNGKQLTVKKEVPSIYFSKYKLFALLVTLASLFC